MIHIAVFFMRLLEAAFLLGLMGSAIVVILSFVEDFGELFHRDEA